MNVDKSRTSILTPLEKKLLLLLSQGLAKVEVGRRLNISKHTVDRYVRNVFDKLGKHTTTSVVAEAIRRGEID